MPTRLCHLLLIYGRIDTGGNRRIQFGDPFKDTSPVALNPIIKFTTGFGLLAVELAVSLSGQRGSGFGWFLAGLFLLTSIIFIWRSFLRIRIGSE